ncbi:MAG TPA: DNA repair protein RecO [Burkholderiaceae bacterium]|nr:DNA repair protein RecO [Burkholderiaceae bacterium]
MVTRAPRLPSTQPAFVLHHYDWSETSLILDLFTREQGRLAVVAKGAKRPYSQLRSVLLPFQRLQVGLSKPSRDERSETEVQTLRSAEWAGGHPLPSGAALFAGYYLNELLLKLLARQDPHPRIFDAYAATIPLLSEDEDQRSQAALRAFELRLLADLGLLPDLSVVTQTQRALDPERLYMLGPEMGVCSLSHEAPAFGAPQLVQLQAALLHGSQAALQQACADCLPSLKACLRGLLHYHLGHKPLRTRAVMLDLQKLLD